MTTPAARNFHLGDLLSVTTGRILAPEPDGLFRILNFMTTRIDVPTITLAPLGKCAHALLTQHPWLASIHPPEDFGTDPYTAVPAWLAEQVAIYGEQHPVKPLAADHTRIDPLTEPAAQDTHAAPIVNLPPRPPSALRQALGCPVTGCDWHSQPFPATGRHNPTAVAAYIQHIYDEHPQYRELIDDARASSRAGAQP